MVVEWPQLSWGYLNIGLLCSCIFLCNIIYIQHYVDVIFELQFGITTERVMQQRCALYQTVQNYLFYKIDILQVYSKFNTYLVIFKKQQKSGGHFGKNGRSHTCALLHLPKGWIHICVCMDNSKNICRYPPLPDRSPLWSMLRSICATSWSHVV